MDANTPENWYKNLPPFTKIILTTVFFVTIAVMWGILNPMLIALSWPFVVKNLHIWRPFTNFFFLGKFSFQWLIQMYFLSSFGQKLEKSDKFANPADFAFFLIFNLLGCSMLSAALNWPDGVPFNGASLIFAILYYWSRLEPDAMLSIYGFNIQGYKFPFFFMGFSLLMGGDVWGDLVGLGSAHMYHFLRDIAPLQYGKSYIQTPAFLQRQVQKMLGAKMEPEHRTGPVAFAAGGGRRLGGD